MVLSDFLSRPSHDESKPHKVIPISFNMHSVLHEKYCNIGKTEKFGYKHNVKPNLVELNFQMFMV